MNAQTFSSKVKSILTDNAGKRRETGHTAGRLDAGKIAKLACGNGRVFSRSTRSKYSSYAITLLLDASGSMRKHRLNPACRAVARLYGTLTDAGASVSVRPFNARLFDPLKPVDLRGDEDRFVIGTRALCLDDRKSTHGNHDGYAVEICSRELLARPEPGKVLIVLSDGMPRCDYADDFPGCRFKAGDGESNLIANIANARKSGVTVLGLGIETDQGKRLYGERAFSYIETPDETFERVAVMLDRNIVRG